MKQEEKTIDEMTAEELLVVTKEALKVFDSEIEGKTKDEVIALLHRVLIEKVLLPVKSIQETIESAAKYLRDKGATENKAIWAAIRTTSAEKITTAKGKKELIEAYRRAAEIFREYPGSSIRGTAALIALGMGGKAPLEVGVAKLPQKLDYPVDKANAQMWMGLQEADGSGQLALNFDMGDGALCYYTLTFDASRLPEGVRMTKKPTPFDERVYIAVALLWKSGARVITLPQIHRAMGRKGTPSQDQADKINNSITKMGAARLYIDSSDEVKIHNKYKAFTYDADLLPFERLTAKVRGGATEAAIGLFREPPMITFARERGQLQSIPLKVLAAPVNQTDDNLAIEKYLLDHIVRMCSPKSQAQPRMLYETIFKALHITEKRKKTRALQTIKKYLEHYKTVGFIIDFEADERGITITPKKNGGGRATLRKGSKT